MTTGIMSALRCGATQIFCSLAYSSLAIRSGELCFVAGEIVAYLFNAPLISFGSG
jgi:hypothetical protein